MLSLRMVLTLMTGVLAITFLVLLLILFFLVIRGERRRKRRKRARYGKRRVQRENAPKRNNLDRKHRAIKMKGAEETEEIEIRVLAKGALPPKVRIVIEITAEGHYTSGYVPVNFLNRA